MAAGGEKALSQLFIHSPERNGLSDASTALAQLVQLPPRLLTSHPCPKYKERKLNMVLHSHNPSTEAETSRSLGVQGQPRLQSEFKASLGT